MSPLPSIQDYNAWSTKYRVVWDDGDHVPTGLDLYMEKGSGERLVLNADLFSDLASYYRLRGALLSEHVEKQGEWQRKLQSIRFGDMSFSFVRESLCSYRDERIPYTTYYSCRRDEGNEETWVLLAVSKFRDLLPSGFSPWGGLNPAYALTAHIVYKSDDVIEKFVSFVESHPDLIPLNRVLYMERTAKARGHVKLGKKLHRIFVSRQPGSQFSKLDIKDQFGDDIYLEREKEFGSKTWETWQLAQKLNLTADELQTLARFLGLMIEVHPPREVEEKSELMRGAEAMLKLYRSGFPLPQHFEYDTLNDIKVGGTFNPLNDTLQLASDISAKHNPLHHTAYHEYGHFLVDLMDDRHGPNETDFVPMLGSKHLFDPDDCSILGSVSGYGGQCDAERGRFLRKAKEDPAETIRTVMDELMVAGEQDVRRFPLDLFDEVKGELARADAALSQREKGPYREVDSLERILRLLPQYIPEFRRPPVRGENDVAYVQEMKTWFADLQPLLDGALEKRTQKLNWARSIVRSFIDAAEGLGHPNPHIAPWEHAEIHPSKP